MTDQPENPPAFPSIETHPSFDMPMHYFGMTLRDYFAGQAVRSVMHLCARDTLIAGETIEAAFARKAYDIADAMLRERGK